MLVICDGTKGYSEIVSIGTKLDETKHECIISSNDYIVDRMKIQKIKYVPKSGMSYSAGGSPLEEKYLVYGAGGRQVCWSHLCPAPVSTVTHRWSGTVASAG